MSEPSTHPEEYHDTLQDMLELVWGEGFLSPGGPEAVRAIVGNLNLSGKQVLDVGCGLGGIDVLLAREYEAHVLGLEVERRLVERARRRIEELGLSNQVEIRLYAPGPLPIPDKSMDVVFGKDSWIHIEDKQGFFAEIFRVLKPGGWLAAGDWMRGAEPYSQDMEYFFELEGLTYHMDTLENYGRGLRQCGFLEVELMDISEAYRSQAHAEYQSMLGPLNAPMREMLGEQAQAHFIENWRAMTVVLDNGELRPGRLWARKPAAR